jgi:hypothetical protein
MPNNYNAPGLYRLTAAARFSEYLLNYFVSITSSVHLISAKEIVSFTGKK